MTTVTTRLFQMTFNLTVKAVKTWLKSQGETASPLVEEWIRHYFFGGGTEKTLPVKAIEETKKGVIKSLKALWERPSWERINLSYAGGDYEDDYKFFTTLSGVVGHFNYKLIPTNKGLKVLCEDYWDFNCCSEELQIKISNSLIQTAIIKIANTFDISIEKKEDNTLTIYEEELTRLNPSRAFYTKWEFFIAYEELPFMEGNHTDYIWELGGIPKWWEQQEAMTSALTDLGVFWREEEIGKVFIIMWDEEGKQEKYPLNWENVTLLREIED